MSHPILLLAPTAVNPDTGVARGADFWMTGSVSMACARTRDPLGLARLEAKHDLKQDAEDYYVVFVQASAV